MRKKPDEDSDKKDWLRQYAKYSSLAFQMIIIVLIGAFGGWELDKVLELKFPVFTVILILVATFLSLFYMIRTLLKK